MVDLQETPAVPPFDGKNDERLGYFVAGGILIALGWGMGVLLNVLLHLWAPSGGHAIEGVWFSPHWGAYAWAVLLFGAGTGALGAVLVALGRSSPRGTIVLPGANY